jgi:hypothetical protein
MLAWDSALPSIRTVQGYDAATGLWCHNIPTLAVPKRPTKKQTETALKLIRQTFRTFPFADSRRKDDSSLGVSVVDLDAQIGLDESLEGTFLPGDIKYESPNGNVRIYFPIVTAILLSLVFTLVLRASRRV